MGKKIEKIVIVGGGSAGWMSAATLIKAFPNKDITLIESPNVPIIGVGESTLGHFNQFLNFLEIKDQEFMKECDATYKLSISFTDFYEKGSGTFHYPFGGIDVEGNMINKNDWYFKKIIYPETPVSDYAESVYPIMALVNENKISDKNNIVPGYTLKNSVAYHIDAVKFGIWLREKYAKPRGVKHIQSEVVDVVLNEDGIDFLTLKDSSNISADLFVDCTGFKSLLLEGHLKEPFRSAQNILPNSHAWATRIQYTNKKEQLKGWTDCHALGNGWVWNTPLWIRMGTGYVYSDKYISHEDALNEFKEHLKVKGTYNEQLEFRNIVMKSGIHERIWVKNVVAIGLSAGFIEPLESNGLFSVHEFLRTLIRSLARQSKVNQIDKDMFNYTCLDMYHGFCKFVASHYAFSNREDTEYWRDVSNREYSENLNNTFSQYKDKEAFCYISQSKFRNFEYDNSGTGAIMTGLHNFPTDEFSIAWFNDDKEEFYGRCREAIRKLEEKKAKWKEMVKDCPSLYQYMEDNIYNS